MTGAHFGQGIELDAECNPSIHSTLRQCLRRHYYRQYCRHAGVRCEQILKSVSATHGTTPNCNTVMINVKLHNNNITNLFQVACYNQHHVVYAVLNETNNFTTRLSGLFPSTFYTCCASVIYQHFVGRGTCTKIKTSELLTTSESSGPLTTT